MTATVSEIIEGLMQDAEAALAAGVPAKASAIYRGVLLHDPEHVLALRQCGALMLHQDNALGALEFFQRAVKLSPSDPDLYHGVATALRLVGHAEDAVLAFQAGLRIDPGHAPTLYDLGLLQRQRGKLDEAEVLLRRAAASGAGQSRFEAELQRAVALFKQDRLPEAERWFHRAGLLNPADPRPWINVAMIYRTWGHLDAALRCLEKALTAAPDNPEVHWNLANTILVRGEFARGFEEYEWRFRRAGRAERAMALPRWAGEDLRGKTLLLAAEQGMGDLIQFARFARPLAARGAKVVVECHPGLESLLATAPGVSAVVALGQTVKGADFYLPMMSVAHALGVDEASVTRSTYLSVPPGPAVSVPGAGVKVGLAWRGNPRHENDVYRSIALSTLQPILDVDGATFISLQVGEARAEIGEAKIHDLSPQLTDFAATARAVEQLDVLISVDTAVAHLAGALGKPVWLLLARGNDWRWGHQRVDTPWYSSMKLFRQAPHRDWSVPVRQIAAALRSLIG
jgi:Flp pilus assembly protein TadD